MKLLKENSRFDITEYCGNLIVTFLSADKENVQPLLEFLDKNGYEYIKNELAMHTVLKNSYLSNIERELDSCGCCILYLTNNFNDPKYRVLKNNILYQVGYLDARREDIITPFIEKGSSVNLSGTPLMTANTISTYKEILDMLQDSGDRFRSIVMQNKFYDDQELNYLTKDRIEYRRLLVSLEISKRSFKNAFAKYRSKTGERSTDEKLFVNVLRDNLTCGARIISFGTKSRLTTHLSPYANEMECINTVDFPKSFTCSHLYKEINEKEKGNLKAKYLLEIILPIHNLLGVNFKPFVKAKAPLDAEILEILFGDNFSKQNDIHISGNTIYFSLDFPNAEPFDFDRTLDIGKIADYLYPQ